MSVVEFGIEKGYVEKEEDENFEHYTIHPRRVLNSFVLEKIRLEFEENGFSVYNGDDKLIHCVKPPNKFDYQANYELLIRMVEALRSDSLVSQDNLFGKIATLYEMSRKMEEERNVARRLSEPCNED